MHSKRQGFNIISVIFVTSQSQGILLHHNDISLKEMNCQIMIPLEEFARLIGGYFEEIWSFLMFIGSASSFLFILIGAIMLFVGVKVGTTTGSGLVLGGMILAIVIAYFTLYPPDFTLD